MKCSMAHSLFELHPKSLEHHFMEGVKSSDNEVSIPMWQVLAAY